MVPPRSISIVEETTKPFNIMSVGVFYIHTNTKPDDINYKNIHI